jgi:hypothetical protein
LSGARISDPEVLRALRHGLIVFEGDVRRALLDVATTVSQVSEWLGRDRLAHWKKEERRCAENVRQAKAEYSSKVRGPRTIMRDSGFDELKRLQRAKRNQELAEEKIALVKRWSRQLEEQTRPLLGSCNLLARLLDTQIPRALARLDAMLDSLDAYQRELKE